MRRIYLVDILALVLITIFLITYFEPKYLFSKTITTGGDTASHYHTAKYLKEVLLPKGKIIGWDQGNYAGFPLFQFYFPLPFLIMVLFSLVIPLQIAFKIVTVLGMFLLPICTYFSLRLLKYTFPTPIFGAILTLPFLFMEANSMWGGNITSTLAGEFAFSLGFALSILFIGSLYNGILSGKHAIKNAILIALIGFSHGYTLLFSGLASLFFLITTEDFLKKLKYLFKVHVLGFLLMGLWIVPLIVNLPYTTRYNYIWIIKSLLEVFPLILIPFIAIAVLGRVVDLIWLIWKGGNWRRIWDNLNVRIYYLWFGVIVSIFFYYVAYKINVVDIRFLPFLQVFLVLIGAVELGRVVKRLKAQWLFPVILFIAVFLWVDFNVKAITSWVIWNYTGFESKTLWPVFSTLNKYISGTASDPRVVYEHSSDHNAIGTIRSFESIPLFSGRSTLEGIYMQSTVTSPFVFYLQSEISKEISCPLPDYGCSTLNLKRGIEHLKMFNVRDFIVRSDAVKKEIKKYPEFVLKKSFGPYEVYELTTNENRYVRPLPYEPILFKTDNWKRDAYRWFKNENAHDIHLVFTSKTEEKDLKRLKNVKEDGDLNNLPKIPINFSCYVEEEIKEEEVKINTSCIGVPLLIKISYHPDWEVEGADKVYLVSPSFMLVYPERSEIRLKFSKRPIEYLGNYFTITALLMVFFNIPHVRKRVQGFESLLAGGFQDSRVRGLKKIFSENYFYRYVDRNRMKVLVSILIIIVLFLSAFSLASKREDPHVLYHKGVGQFNKKNYKEAKEIFERVIKNHPETSAANNASYYYTICFFKENNYQKTIEGFQRLVRDYPDSNWVPEAYYHIALSNAFLNKINEARDMYQYIINNFPTTPWARRSWERLVELAQKGDKTQGKSTKPEGATTLYNAAMGYFDQGKYSEARELFLQVVKGYPENKLAEHSMYFYAVCFFKENKYTEMIKEFEKLIKVYPASDYAPEAHYHIGLGYQRLKDLPKAKKAFSKVIKDFPKSRWAGYSKEKLKEIK